MSIGTHDKKTIFSDLYGYAAVKPEFVEGDLIAAKMARPPLPTIDVEKLKEMMTGYGGLAGSVDPTIKKGPPITHHGTWTGPSFPYARKLVNLQRNIRFRLPPEETNLNTLRNMAIQQLAQELAAAMIDEGLVRVEVEKNIETQDYLARVSVDALDNQQ